MLTASLARDEPSIKRPLSLAPRSLHQLSRPPSPCSPVCRQCGGCSFPQDPPTAASGGDREPPPFPKTELCAGPAFPSLWPYVHSNCAAQKVKRPGPARMSPTHGKDIQSGWTVTFRQMPSSPERRCLPGLCPTDPGLPRPWELSSRTKLLSRITLLQND